MKLQIAAARKMSIGQALMLLLVLRFAQGSRLVEQLDGHFGQHTVSKNNPSAQGDLASLDAKTLLDRCLADAACSASLTAAARQWLPSHPLRPAAGVQPAGDDSTNTGSSSSASSIQATANTPTAITGVSWSSRTEGRQQGDEGADGEETSLTLKGWAAAALLVEAVAGMYLPLLLQRLRSPQWWLSLLNCFSGGIFLAAGIIHLLPHCAEAQEALGPIGPNGGDYPLYLVLVVVGYCLVFYVERVLFDVHGEGHTHCQHSNVFSHSCYYEAISHRPHNHRSCGHVHTNHNHNHQGCCGGGGSGGEGAVEGSVHRGHDRSHSRSHRHKPLQGPPALLIGAPEGASRVRSEDSSAGGRCVGGGFLLTLGAQAGAAEGTGAVCTGVVPSLADVLLVGAQQGRGQQEPEEEEDAESCHSHHTPRAVCVCVEGEEEEEEEQAPAHNHHRHHDHHNHHHNHHQQLHQHHGSLHVPLLAAEVTAAAPAATLPAVAPPAANGSAGGCSGGTSGDACSVASWQQQQQQQQTHPQLLLPEPASCPYHLQHPATLHHQHPHQHHPHHRPGGAPHSNDSSLSSSSSSHYHLNHHHNHHHHHNHNHHNHQGNSNHSGSDQLQPHSHSHPLLLTHQRHHTIKPRFRFMHGVVLLLALALHTSLECIALGLLQQRRQFLLLLAAIASHKAVSALALSSRFLKEGATMKQVTIYVGPFCLVAPLSILAGVYVGRVAPLASLVFSCFATGTFLYVGASEVIMEEFEGEMRADRRDISTAAARYIKFGAVLAAVALVAASGLLPEPEGHH
ncbi:hypothetical protein Agub_g9184 [Astrephomene gubernaculifera]|uniref:Uncharacterized protein n=1 Tax=Astrephomene gubernaculifera TaxID=47775 RepID=A0AAD3DT72_9CHLO|nr:hypothetical protein Agub_g9184 [Astrephomene gubernaculifera]